MKTFEEIAQSLSAEYSLRTKELRVFRERRREGKLVFCTVVPESDESDFWHGEVIDGVDVDFNLYDTEGSDYPYSMCVYRVIDGRIITDFDIEVPLSVLNTYYCVATTIYGSTRMVCNLVASVEAEEKPEQAFKSGSVADRYLDYFDTEEEALQFVAQSKNA